MSKTQEELQQIKKDYESLKNKLKDLSDDELKQIAGGIFKSSVEHHFSIGDIIYMDRDLNHANYWEVTCDTICNDNGYVPVEEHRNGRVCRFNEPAFSLMIDYNSYGGICKDLR